MLSEKTTYSYWDLENVLSNNFNRFKAKLFNLVEASIANKEQSEAIKGLIKGFANDEYKNCVEEMRYHARLANLYPKGEDSSIPPLSANPLESELIK